MYSLQYMPCSHLGVPEYKWNITPFCSGAGTEKTERAFTRLWGVGINLASRYGNVSRAGYAPLCTHTGRSRSGACVKRTRNSLQERYVVSYEL